MSAHTYLRFAGVADKDNDVDVREARRATHDAVIEDLGDKRTSGVTWSEYDAKEAGRILDELGLGGEAAGLKKYLAASPDGCLVIAMAECSEPVS